MGYYLLAGAIITGIGYLYVYESDRIIELGTNISWEATKMVTIVSEYFGNYVKKKGHFCECHFGQSKLSLEMCVFKLCRKMKTKT